MTFQPVIPLSGYAGWSFLTRTLDRQQAAFAQSPQVQKATDYFRANVGKALTAEDLVSDRGLLQVALGAFGLDQDINAKAFVRKVLEDGTVSGTALSSRLADRRYAQLAFAFGYGNVAPQVNVTGFAEKIIARYMARQFEAAVGEQDGPMRQALNFGTSLGDVLASNSSQNARWFGLMGNTSLRNMFETALGLPASFGALHVDQQLVVFKDRSQSVFGTDDLADFTDPERREDLIRLFMVRSDLAAGTAGYVPGQLALTLLQG